MLPARTFAVVVAAFLIGFPPGRLPADAAQAPAEHIVIGDMLFAPDQITSDRQAPAATTVFSATTTPWPGGIMPIAFDATVTPGQRAQFMRVCNGWGARTPGVECVVHTVERVALTVFNRQLSFNGGQSTVGYHATSPRQLTVSPTAWVDSLVLHEAGHSFGFMHEHQRPDRDQYVTIDTTNIAAGFTGAFSLLASATTQTHGLYDFLSIMHYHPRSFAADPSRNVITARPPYQGLQGQMGTRTVLSALDLGGMVAIYGTVPGTPTGVIAATTATGVTLSWSAAATGGTPASYTIAAGTAPGATDLGTFNLGPATSVSAGLAPATYYVRISGVNERGTSVPSSEISFTITGSAPAPGAPRNLTADLAGSTLTIAWLPAESGGAVSSYVVEAGSTTGASDIHNAAVGTATTLTAVVPLRTYFIRVRARNAIGLSAPSSEIQVNVTSTCTVPAAPVVAGSTRGNLATVSWPRPSGGPITHYIVKAGRSPGASDLFDASIGLSTSASGTLSSGTYYVRALAVAACGTSPVSNEAIIQVP